MKSNLSRSILFLVFAATLACKSEPAKPADLAAQPSVSPVAVPTAEPTPTPEVISPAPVNFKKTFVGTIGEGAAAIPVWMDIERKGAIVMGNYYYDKPGAYNVAEKMLDLKGKVDKDGNVTITETDYDNEAARELQTGNFKGKVDAVGTGTAQMIRLMGAWSGTKDKKSLAVNLKELHFDLGGMSLGNKAVKDGGRKKRIQIGSNLPQLSIPIDAATPGATPDPALSAKVEKFNKTVMAFVTNRTKEFKKNMQDLLKQEAEAAKTAAPETPAEPAKEPVPENVDRPFAMDVNYVVTAASKDYISILFTFYEDTGGAHPNTNTASFNYDFNRNEALKLADLFAPKANYLKTISDYCTRELKKLKTADFVEEGASAKLENFDSWNLTAAGIRFTFDPYQVGPYAAGEHEVVMPYQALKPILKPDGLLAQYAK
jgi:hypothetical protein